MIEPMLHVVHCIDTEGPLDEDLPSTFERLKQIFDIELEPSVKTLEAIQNKQMDLGGKEDEVARVFSKQILRYNRNWQDVDTMLRGALSPEFRNQMQDDAGGGWVYSWHCMDHMGFAENPRHKDIGYGNVFHFYQHILAETGSKQDEVNWHFHPLSVTRHPLSAATSYSNSMDVLLYILARRVIEDSWFPTCNRPGFHAERPDSHTFLEQWIPFDYANQACSEANSNQKDLSYGRFGNWERAPQDWLGYHPHHDDYQTAGDCRRWIFRCLNVGTRLRLMTADHVDEAFCNAAEHGSAILSFADHDYRDIRPDVDYVRALLGPARKKHPNVKLRFSGAEQAAREHIKTLQPDADMAVPEFDVTLEDNRFYVQLKSGALFGPQPFLAIQDKAGHFHHDNFDEVERGKHWCYVLDSQTMPASAIATIAAAGAGPAGGFDVKKLTLGG